jgi:flagellar motor protein MotB
VPAVAGKGGGAWKVAYADFVTAMMAFFLVMWIVAQDTKVKEQIEHYFVTPMGYAPIGERYQSKAGGAFESKSSGNMPLHESVAMGRGRAPHADIDAEVRRTRMISEWLRSHPEECDRWKERADQITAGKSRPPADSAARDAVAIDSLAQMLSSEFHEQMPLKSHSMYRDLLLESLSDVDWEQIAEELIRE